MPLNLENVVIGEMVESDKGKYKLLQFIVVAIKGNNAILRFKHPLPTDKNIKVPLEKLAQNYTRRADYLNNLFTIRY